MKGLYFQTGWLLIILSLLQACNKDREELIYSVSNKQIIVDGNPDDWKNVKANIVKGKDNLWFGQGMVSENWQGNDDLSFQWKATWYGNKLYFIVEVNDDTLSGFDQPNSWLNDCVEICLDPDNTKGLRKREQDGKDILIGYETHYVPCDPPKIFLNELIGPYEIDSPQNELFLMEWNGEISVLNRNGGYIVELGFSVPGLTLNTNKRIGIEVGVCDDDGEGRKNLMMWTGMQVDFWITMNEYGELILK